MVLSKLLVVIYVNLSSGKNKIQKLMMCQFQLTFYSGNLALFGHITKTSFFPGVGVYIVGKWWINNRLVCNNMCPNILVYIVVIMISSAEEKP